MSSVCAPTRGGFIESMPEVKGTCGNPQILVLPTELDTWAPCPHLGPAGSGYPPPPGLRRWLEAPGPGRKPNSEQGGCAALPAPKRGGAKHEGRGRAPESGTKRRAGGVASSGRRGAVQGAWRRTERSVRGGPASSRPLRACSAS